MGELAIDQTRTAVFSHQPIGLCYQCDKCAAGCPMAPDMDLLPSQVIRLLQYGLVSRVLTSHTPWLCSGCETCAVRCPNGISIAAVMDGLKQMAATGRVRGRGRKFYLFHRLFLLDLRWQGRLYELGLMGAAKLVTMQLFSDLGLAVAMLRRGKLKILPSFPNGSADMARIFATLRKKGERS